MLMQMISADTYLMIFRCSCKCFQQMLMQMHILALFYYCYCTVTPLFAISINYRGFYCLLESRSIMVYCLCLLHKIGHTFTFCCTRYVYICTMTFYGSLCNNAIVIATSALANAFSKCLCTLIG